jgi:hypothetical protein
MRTLLFRARFSARKRRVKVEVFDEGLVSVSFSASIDKYLKIQLLVQFKLCEVTQSIASNQYTPLKRS